MILYDYCRSSAAYRVRIALNLKGLAYEQVPVNLLQAEHRGEEHLARNPQGLVPAFEDNGVMINQSLAICEYLDDAYPQTAPLVAGTPADKARIRGLAQLIACDIHPVDNLRVLKYLVGELGASEEQKLEWYRHWIHEGFKGLERRLAESNQTGKFCHGDTPTLADVCLVPQVFNANRFETDLSAYPTIVRINEACNELKAFADAHPNLQPGA
ncbi:maleylacetoacetate isomerase [Marinobacterium arenosum]|uniref:maleylacetoacetate isomerase n=1 Tax=Marinobacterium arenosum TaxID=2862496 RepID=UPI001C9684C4|nr:maleylacetoacetate isomerase [Marinobacterium arenosum]MBY4678148.1 maleylacetoacetate isomerase [Marinobacterium arenosum]